jgi:hypothetical protein
MTKALTELVAELQEDVPAVDGIPSEAQYERAIKEAVSEFSRRCGVMKTTSISVVSGTVDYALPNDFMSAISLDSPYDVENSVMVTPSGIIAFDGANPLEETVTYLNGTMRIYPTPTYSTTRYLDYKAAWVLDDDENYPLTDDEARIILIKAKIICFEKLANASAGAGFKYSVGNMSVDKSGMADGYSKRQYELHGEFVKACEEYNGAVIL